ncbi:MAG: redox-sensing transcriptional repressor Rex [Candidatus Aureabacteria bacterium]|nr:redox-sensing transcriptional repressor Rex [Candidatus Auribacterota bacterium]
MASNRNCVIRLSRYKNALYRFEKLGFVKVFSDNLGEAVGVTAAQVRKDFSLFGITGNKRGGYQVKALIEKMNEILGKNELQNVVIVGSGNIGNALIKYKGFEKEGIKIVAAFDIDPAKFRDNSEIPVLSLERLKDFVKKSDVKIGVLAVPDIAAQQVADMMISSGIKGILNFAPINLRAPADIIVNYVNLELEIENLIYFVNAMDKTGKKSR